MESCRGVLNIPAMLSWTIEAINSQPRDAEKNGLAVGGNGGTNYPLK